MEHQAMSPDAPVQISFEFFPPKDETASATLERTLSELKTFSPSFVSVTYGAGGSTRDRSLTTAGKIRSETGIPTIGHLTCVGATRAELADQVTAFADAGLDGILALRGDPVGGPAAAWLPTENGLNHADELVEMIRSVSNLSIGVAAFPDVHPASGGDAQKDIDVLLRKEELGATFAITQFVFASERYEQLISELERHGSKLKVYPGIMPVTSYLQSVRMLELSGGHMPTATRLRFARYQNDPDSIRKLGIEVATQICEDVFALGAPGLHFYTLNQSEPTKSVLQSLSMLP